jgi:hypothetical protein
MEFLVIIGIGAWIVYCVIPAIKEGRHERREIKEIDAGLKKYNEEHYWDEKAGLWFKKDGSDYFNIDTEIKQVQEIKLLCETGKWSARSLADNEINDEMRVYEHGVYTKRKEAALELARGMKDDFCRDAALHAIIDLCMEGQELAHARQLFNVVEVDVIREKILGSYPQLNAKF